MSNVRERQAVISGCGQYRYTLSRQWGDERPCVFVMLNPSTADAEKDDPTIRRCIHFAKREGCGALFVVNLFAFRATSPAAMKKARDPIGPDNDYTLTETFKRALLFGSPVIAAWGTHGTYRARNGQVNALARGAGVSLHCLGRTATGIPKHPLYLPNDAPLSFYRHNGPTEALPGAPPSEGGRVMYDEWQPIATCPDDVLEALLFWPALRLNDDGYTTGEPFVFASGSRGLIGRGVREPGFAMWEGGDFELDANGSAFDDDYAFGNPTHWMPLPPEPSA